jgi:hypothetical protein
MLRERTGITMYYTAYRPETLSFVKRHSKDIALAFKGVSANSGNSYEKVRSVARLIGSMGTIRVAGRSVNVFKGLTPTLSCLDPQRRFPIMNKRSHPLLKCIEEREDVEGIVALSKLTGFAADIHDTRELDAYVNTARFSKKQPRKTVRIRKKSGYKDIGVKSEINSLAQIAEKRTTITKLHNKLINQLNDYLLGRQVTAKESRFDALVLGWKRNRDLLIEAKTASEDSTGRAQIRQAIGQLYDYRFTFMSEKNVDLAVLLPKEPRSEIKSLLDSLGIEILWFKGKKLTGTIQL